MFGIDKFQEGQNWIDRRKYNLRSNLISVIQCHSYSAIAFDNDLLDRRVAADLYSERTRRTGDGFGDSACSAFCKSPRTKRTIDFTHVMMKQNICSGRRARAQK